MDYEKLADERIVDLVAHGDRQALAALYDRYGRLVFSLVVRVLGEGMAAEEVTQDTFLSVWRGAPGFQPERGKFSSWVLTIARNRAIDQLRRSRDRLKGEGVELTDAVVWEESQAQRFEDGSVQRLAMRRALTELPPAQKQAIELAYFRGMTQQEIAEALNEPLGTIKTRIRLGMIRLKALVGEQSNGTAPDSNSDPG